MKYLLHLSVFIFSLNVFAQSSVNLPDEVATSIKNRIEYGLNPSIVVGMIDAKGAHFYNFGVKTINGEEVDEHTIYEIGSISKVFTGILLAKQVEEGTMNLDDPIKQYLPADIKVPNRENEEITLGHLSDHTSALPRLPGNMNPLNPDNPYEDYTVQQLYDFISGYELQRDIGSAYEYSNLAQGLLGHILSINSGVDYEALMIREIAKPLHMEETKITFDEKMNNNLATGHANGREVENWDIPTLAGAGAIRSSTSDMLKFLRANLELVDTPLSSAMKLSHTPRHDKAGNNKVGLGWHIISGKNGDVTWHNGGTGGYRAFAGFVKEINTGVVILTNSTESVDDIGFYMLNPSAELRVVKPSISMELKTIIDSEGIEAALNRYNRIKNEESNEYDFNESAINTLGYSYMDKDITVALAIFKLNVDEYPNSFNVYDSYGEALLKNKQNELAVENYKKSIELNPGNVGGIRALEKLGVIIEEKEIVLTEDLLETYVGTYELQPGFNIVITRESTNLFGQATGQGRFQLFSKNETEFYLKVVAAQISFKVSKTNGVESLTLFQNGNELIGNKIE